MNFISAGLFAILISAPAMAAPAKRYEISYRVSPDVVQVCISATGVAKLNGLLGVEVSWPRADNNRWSEAGPIILTSEADHIESPAVLLVKRQGPKLGSRLLVSFGLCIDSDACIPYDETIRLNGRNSGRCEDTLLP